jgi:exopolysaccharide production protein ExoY
MAKNLNPKTILIAAKNVHFVRSPSVYISMVTPQEQARKDWVNSDQMKRAFDVVAVSLLLLFFMPIMLVIMGVLAICHPGPIIFRHRRIGLHGAPFQCLKFRTMCRNADDVLAAHLAADPASLREWKLTQKMRNDPRVLPIGAFLRRSSLDELPQLINVLMGHMSLVGPRPITFGEVVNYGENFRDYLSVRPGISGLWQVSGRNDTSYDERVALDVEYARMHSMSGDLKILLRTVDVVVRGRGAY